MDDSSVLEELIGPLRAEFHARRTTALVRTDAITQALERYMYEVELEVARQLAGTHSLRQLRERPDLRRAAQDLLNTVLLLPELTENLTPTLTPPAVAPAPPKPPAVAPAPTKPSTAAPGPSIAQQPTEAPKSPWPAITRALARAQLVIVGGAPHLDRLRLLPPDVLKAVEWVDTRQKGTHAIGNLERRVREHRISALLLLEGLVQHKHTDPLVSAARSASVPCVYAGKGGMLAISNALKEIEKVLSAAK